MKIIIGSTEGTVKKGVELNLDDLLTKIKNDFNGSIDEWWDNDFMDMQMDMEVIEEGYFSENIEFFIQDEEGNSYNAFEFLEMKLK